MEPAYHNDILDDLCHQNGAPLRAISIRESLGHIQDTMARAADEIRKLREEKEELRKQLKEINSLYQGKFGEVWVERIRSRSY